ncbi:maleylpyruvate isomerase family mycothiol-dependent enzyme [Kribbella turkmenica]|uniref:Maleylpyruvate isomerase family mycothiol-dependent enzyme n=1 Tax=Kribbella turkmenica TaxID=2530375 RepID=A0A4V2YGK3_9ACTN|nr:maleylpyruvate isomerase N-terminal domain-containing protein [Kribbella turkmenica]TDD27377.1 maleylpyruvate isomerase family mycothiol-dependent enzyme [Kribbella turkmenica]
MSELDPVDHLAEFERTAAEFAAVLDRADPAAAVPGCPGWTLADLALHLGSGQRWAAAILLSGTRQKVPEVLRTTISWADWYAGTTAALAAAIRAVDPDEPCWNFAPVEQRAGFWSRRRLHETVIHLVDAVQAGADADGRSASGLTVVPPRIAADGVDEVFGVFLARMLARGFAPAVTRQIGVRATDTGDEWTLTPAADGGRPRVERGKAAGEAVVSGTAAELDLCLWKRLPTGVLTVAGDPAVAAAFLAGTTTP